MSSFVPKELILVGETVRLEILEPRHCAGLLAAAQGDPELYRWTFIPRTGQEAQAYVDTARKWHREGTALPFATVRKADGVVIGSTRIFQIERWPRDAACPAPGDVDGCEIGYTWLTQGAVRTAANTESKLLLLAHAFEVLRAQRVCLHTDARNERSRAAIERIGGQFEGILRAHRPAVDGGPRNSARYSILASEWPDCKRKLLSRLQG